MFDRRSGKPLRSSNSSTAAHAFFAARLSASGTKCLLDATHLREQKCYARVPNIFRARADVRQAQLTVGDGGGNHADQEAVARHRASPASRSANGGQAIERPTVKGLHRPLTHFRQTKVRPLAEAGLRKLGRDRRRGAQTRSSRPALDVLIQRCLKQPTTFRQVVQRCAQLLNLLAAHSGCCSWHCACRSRGVTPRDLWAFIAGDIARDRYRQRSCARRHGRFGLLIPFDLTLGGGLRSVRMPDILHEAHPLLPEETLDAPDRVTLTIQKMANAAQEIEIVRPVIAATAATLHRPDLAEATFPEPQYMLRNLKLLRHFADGPECARCLLHRRSAPRLWRRYFLQAGL